MNYIIIYTLINKKYIFANMKKKHINSWYNKNKKYISPPMT